MKKTNNSIKLNHPIRQAVLQEILTACLNAKQGQSIRLGNLGALRKTRLKGTIRLDNGQTKAYNTYRYSFRAFSALKGK